MAQATIHQFRHSGAASIPAEYERRSKMLGAYVSRALRVRGVDPRVAGGSMGLPKTTLYRHMLSGKITLPEILILSDFMPEFSWDAWINEYRTPREFEDVVPSVEKAYPVPEVEATKQEEEADMNKLAELFGDAGDAA